MSGKHDTTLNEIFCVVSRFPRYFSCYIPENRFPLGQCGTNVTVVSTNKRSQAGVIYSLFSTKYLEDNKDNVHFLSLQGVQQCL